MTPLQPNLPADDVRRHLNEPEAWTQVSSALQRIAFAIVGDEGDAEDVVQGAWLEALKNPRDGQSQGWMRRLVRFRALDALRRRRRNPGVLEGDVPEEAAPDMRWKLDAQREVLEAVHALKEPYLSTVVLRYFEGLGPKEIAAKLHVPERTVKTRLTRAHAMLRESLGARYQDQFGNWAPALVLFSGHRGLKLSSLSVPVTGSVLMKKVILVAAVLAVALMVPFAMQAIRGKDEGLTQPMTTDADLVDPMVTSKLGAPEVSDREAIPELATSKTQVRPTFEYAFPPQAESEVGSLEIRMRWLDGSPAEHMKIRIVPWDAADAFLMRRTVYTDATGFVKVDQLAPGRVGIYYDKIASDKAEVAAGQCTQIEKQVPAGTSFSGQVLDPNGWPVGGAQVFVAGRLSRASLPEPTAIADSSGRYEIQNVFDHSYLSARAPGFSPSLAIETGICTGQPTKLDLNLRANPAVLRGLALSPDGLPVVGAKIRIDLPAIWDEGDNVQLREALQAFALRTDAEGRFELDEIGSGSIELTARTATWQPWVETIELQTDEPAEITIQFERGNQFAGLVLDEEGEPVSKATVLSGSYASLDSFRVQADEEGRFCIKGLPPGPTELRINHDEFEGLKIRVYSNPDTAKPMQFTLHKLQSANGIVLDEAGAPLSDWLVAIEIREGLWSASAKTDENGNFELLGIPDGSTDLIVTNMNYVKSATRLYLPAILPARGPLRIIVPDSINPKGSIRMRILVDGEPAPIETQIQLRTDSPLGRRDVHPKSDGSVHLEQLASKTFHLQVDLEGYATLTKSFHLAALEQLDLGTLHLERGGLVHVQAGESQGTGSFEVLSDQGHSFLWFNMQAGHGTSTPLPTGTVRLRYNALDGATQFAEAEIRSGETTEVRFIERPGTFRQIQIVRSNGQDLRIRTTLSVTDGQGHIHFHSGDLVGHLSTYLQPTLMLTGLELGSYRVQISDPTGQTHDSWLHVNTLDPQEQPVLIELDW